MTLMLYSGVILLGEIRCQSLLRVKGLRPLTAIEQALVLGFRLMATFWTQPPILQAASANGKVNRLKTPVTFLGLLNALR